MADTLKALFDSAVSLSNNGKIKLDKDKAAAFSSRLSKISAEIGRSAAQIEGPMTEARNVWIGQAAEAFFTELSALIKEVKEIGERVEQNRQQADRAVNILMAADNAETGKVSGLSAGGTFKIE